MKEKDFKIINLNEVIKAGDIDDLAAENVLLMGLIVSSYKFDELRGGLLKTYMNEDMKGFLIHMDIVMGIDKILFRQKLPKNEFIEIYEVQRF